ncbi:MAG: hypothetical protein KDC38_03925 [Planctomycetes bacterium]|nr:hypothetical protein [Planctomycetota bacterium]
MNGTALGILLSVSLGVASPTVDAPLLSEASEGNVTDVLLDLAESAVSEVDDQRRAGVRRRFALWLVDERRFGRARVQADALLGESPADGLEMWTFLFARGAVPAGEVVVRIPSGESLAALDGTAALAMARLIEGDIEAALAALPSVVDQPEREAAIVAAGALSVVAFGGEHVERLVRWAFRRNPEIELRARIAYRVAAAHDQPDRALSILEQLPGGASRYPDVVWQIALAYRRQGRLDDVARRMADVQDDRRRAAIALWLAESWSERGGSDRARLAWEAACASFAELPEASRAPGVEAFLRSGSAMCGERWPDRLRDLLESEIFASDSWGRAAGWASLGNVAATRAAAEAGGRVAGREGIDPARIREWAREDQDRAWWVAFWLSPDRAAFPIDEFRLQGHRWFAEAIVDADSREGFDPRIVRASRDARRGRRACDPRQFAEYVAAKLARGEVDAARRATEVMDRWWRDLLCAVVLSPSYSEWLSHAVRRRDIGLERCVDYIRGEVDPEDRIERITALLSEATSVDDPELGSWIRGS